MPTIPWSPSKMRAVLDYEGGKAKEFGIKEKKYGTDAFPWRTYGIKEGQLSYIESFRDLMGKDFSNFDNWIEKRKEAKGTPVHVVDYFGPAYVVDSSKDAPADSVLAVALSDVRTPEQKLFETKKTFFELNLYTQEHWRIIQEYQDNHRINGFDLSFFRPLGACSHLLDETVSRYESEYLRLYYRMLQNSYKMMSKDNGVLLFQLPIITELTDIVLQDVLGVWREKLKKLDIILGQNPLMKHFLKLIKTPNAPKKLPVFSLKELLDAGEERKTLDDRLPLKGP